MLPGVPLASYRCETPDSAGARPADLMDLSLTDDQLFMRDEANRFLAEHASSEAVRAAIAAGGHDDSLWTAIAKELGWCGITIPEDAGGLGLGPFEMVLLLEATGARLAPIPFRSTVSLAAPIIEALGSDDTRGSLLPEIASGNLAVSVALPRPGAYDPFETIDFTAEPDGEKWKLSGTCEAVFDLAAADLVLIAANTRQGLGLFAVQTDQLGDQTRLETLDPTMPLALLSLDGVVVDAAARIDRGELNREQFAQPLLWARLGLAAEQIGAAQGCLDMTLAYLGERVQFGRTIASFQAVKHRCAELVVRIGEARSLLYGAAVSLKSGDGDASREVDGAGILADDVLWQAAEEAVQLHGGVGQTWEYDPHLYLRRAQATAQLFGSTNERLGMIADILPEAAA